MVQVQPNVLRIAIASVCALALFIVFDPLGFSFVSTAVRYKGPDTHAAITHIVLFQFKQEADAAAVETACANFLALKESCLSLNSQQPYIKSMTGGKDNSPEGKQDGLTHGFVMQFATADERNYYLEKDPAHQKFKKEVEPIVQKVTVVDFTAGTF
ncbi:stress responsive A/B barrel domain-containing protein [Lasiosphaeria ovina]|uniref:Stress responsive A/B barrel domain-containing protein n=1 Tax=Lasiosphaeria ovina TaxID=92902 RepID=A0AAE0NFF6_9PEZI|nr:stress responsive A/B barrel domain-containing protein [Lasiosphaeria ovina]